MSARDLLRRVVELEEEHGDENGYVPERLLWEEPGLDYDDYYMPAAEELFKRRLVDRDSSDYATLKATSKGRSLI